MSILPNFYVLIAVRKGMPADKLYYSKSSSSLLEVQCQLTLYIDQCNSRKTAECVTIIFV